MIDIYSSSSNLGDNLSITPLACRVPCRIHMFDDGGCREVSKIFDGISEVVFDNGSPSTHAPQATPHAPISGPHSAKLLAKFNIYNSYAIPFIRLSDEEIEWAHKFVSDMCFGKKLCIIKASTQKANYRTPPDGLIQSIVDKNPDIQFITSGLSDKHPKNNFQHVQLKNVLTMWDYPIRKLAAIYSIVGNYVGPDTGDYHLMLSVGGKADVLVPDSRWDYNHNDFHYRIEDFANEKVRVKYHLWNKGFEQSINGIKL